MNYYGICHVCGGVLETPCTGNEDTSHKAKDCIGHLRAEIERDRDEIRNLTDTVEKIAEHLNKHATAFRVINEFVRMVRDRLS